MRKHILLDYITWYKNQLYFLNEKPNDICTNGFGIHAGPLWGANIDELYILNWYVATSYYTSYLTKKINL